MESTSEELAGEQGADVGPDPVLGAAITLLGIFGMGICGARDLNYPFDVAVAVAVAGAGVFVGSVALSALRQKELEDEEFEDDVEGDEPLEEEPEDATETAAEPGDEPAP